MADLFAEPSAPAQSPWPRHKNEPGTVSVQRSFAKGREKFTTVETSAPYVTAIIDPDWPYTVAPGKGSLDEVLNARAKGRLSGFTRNRDLSKNQYSSPVPLTLDELAALPIAQLVGGYIFLWTVGPFLINGAAQKLLESWGFIPCSILSWAKYDLRNGHGYGGVGFWFLGNAEFCIVAKNPRFPSIRTGVSSLIIAPKGKHSAKPEDVHRLCERRFPGPYLEIFGRRARPGWTVLGEEAPGDGRDIRDSLRGFL